MREMYKNMGICDEVYDYCDNIIKSLHDRFEEIDKNAEYNQMKVIKAMQDNKVAEMHLSGTTGYGYNDIGRDVTEKIFAQIFNTEDSICFTNALSASLSSDSISSSSFISLESCLSLIEFALSCKAGVLFLSAFLMSSNIANCSG